MAYFDPLIFGILWIYPGVMIINVILRANVKVYKMGIFWACQKNGNIPAVMEMWVSEFGAEDKISD